MQTVVDAFQYLALAAALSFLFAYPLGKGRRFWFKSPEGRQMVAAYSLFSVLLSLAVIHNLLGDKWVRWGGRLWIDAGTYAGLSILFFWQTANAWLARSRGELKTRRDERASDDEG